MLYGHAVSALLAPEYRAGRWYDVWQFQRGLTSSLFLLLGGFAFSIATTPALDVAYQLSPALVKRAGASACSSCSATRCTFRCAARRPGQRQ